MEQMRKLPIGIQTFEKLREENYLYVDKTDLIYQIAVTSVPYFLSRPRRFGKSLLLSTFEAYFEGRKDLFKGLAIEKLETRWEQYPVLYLDLNAEKYDCKEALEQMLSRNLSLWEDCWGSDVAEVSLSARFSGVIRRAYEHTGKQTVVLIDEYDKPLLQALLDENLLDEYRRILKAFYGVLKSSDRYLRFVFLTGVTKFAQVSVFSDLNQLNDISMDRAYNALCGITKEELVHTFEPEIHRLGESEGLTFEETVCRLEKQYDGYHFCEDTRVGLFNPFSLLNVFQKLKFGNFWFQTGTPTYLVDLLKQSNYDLRLLIDGVEVTASAFSEYRAEANNPLPMIYQSGYLTIKDYDREVDLYTLKFPNDEVRYGFLNFLVPFYTKVTDDETGFHIAKFMRELRAGEVDAFMERLRVFFSGIPYDLSGNTERHYQAVFYVVFTLMGQFIETEVRSARGRADAVVKTKDSIYAFEFKLDGSAEEALKQIDDRGYLIPYTLDGKRLVKVGVNFSKETRNVDRYIVE
ncbi:ATP-binding protein [Bacteroides helcogenes]|uniref:AAA-ATPase n=2 Tax=Bacteroides helcogenes TaxID=290053 RepID=E6SQ79_BACT6|nr:ATP-binding protein [Bacteroides helcogenes]ADV43938.1 AAA-ATPase [Bacteroides helcogenes P 36-108]